jgi:hypothetical protein
MNPKYYRTSLRDDHRTVCPWCGSVNDHRTGRCCEHVARVQSNGTVLYYWGFLPVKGGA